MEDYKVRMKREYDELCERIEKLESMIVKFYKGELDFELNCPIPMLNRQLYAMCDYRDALAMRNKIEKAW